jgi:probable F420-dependent oxidoreductase
VRLTVAPWGETLVELVDAAKRAEAAGAEAVWVSELHRSATVSLAAIAAATDRVTVGTAIALSFVRSPMTLALEALDLDELSEGRLVLGVGSGVRRLNESWHNVQWGKPVGHMRETVRNIRAFVATAHTGEPIDLDGDYEPMSLRGYERPFQPTRTQIPIYIAALGPDMTRLAGEIGDGWISHELSSARSLRETALPKLEEGLARAGRSRDSFDVVVSACCMVHRDGRQAKRWAAGLVAFYATVRTYEDFFGFHGFADEARAVQSAFREGDVPAMIAAVPDDMVDALTLAGEPDEVRGRLSAYDGLVDSVKLSPPTHYVDPSVTRDAQEAILELVGTELADR